MKKIIQSFFFLFLLIPCLLNGQELEARWGTMKKVKKTSSVPYFDFAGSNDSKVLIIHYGKKGIVFDLYDKSTLNLINSIPLKLKKIEWKKNKSELQYYKGFITEDKVYLFTYLKIKKNVKRKRYEVEMPLFVSTFSFEGEKLSEWKEVGELGLSDIKYSSYDFFNTVPDDVIFNKKHNFFVVKQFSGQRFYDEGLNEIEVDKSISKSELLFTEGGRIWLIGETMKSQDKFDSCLNVSELEYSGGVLTAKSKKCIKTKLVKEISTETHTETVNTEELSAEEALKFYEEKYSVLSSTDLSFTNVSSSIINETKLRILILTKHKDEYFKAEAWEFDLDAGKEITSIEYNLTDEEKEMFKKNAVSLSYDHEKNKEEKKYRIVVPNHTLKNLPIFHSEMQNESVVYSSSSNTEFSGGNQTNVITTTSGTGNNYGYIYTFWINEDGSIQSKWINKRQHGGMYGRGDMFLSYLPFSTGGYNYFVFLGNSYNFVYGNNMRLKSPVSKDAVLGYYSIDSKGNTIYKEFKELSKKLKSPPRTHIYHFDGEKLYILALSTFKNKIRLIEIAPKN
jgi:hypothetical protein